MPKITGVGGIFFKADDQDDTVSWFTKNLGLEMQGSFAMFPWRERETPEKKGYTVFNVHKGTTDYYGPSKQPFMLNFRVDDLDAMLKELEAKGVTIVKRFDPEPNGKFAHIAGPNDLTIELWEPADPDPYDP
jgi:predicted enzyme related to lactoylglutathione lyase